MNLDSTESCSFSTRTLAATSSVTAVAGSPLPGGANVDPSSAPQFRYRVLARSPFYCPMIFEFIQRTRETPTVFNPPIFGSDLLTAHRTLATVVCQFLAARYFGQPSSLVLTSNCQMKRFSLFLTLFTCFSYFVSPAFAHLLRFPCFPSPASLTRPLHLPPPLVPPS